MVRPDRRAVDQLAGAGASHAQFRRLRGAPGSTRQRSIDRGEVLLAFGEQGRPRPEIAFARGSTPGLPPKQSSAPKRERRPASAMAQVVIDRPIPAIDGQNGGRPSSAQDARRRQPGRATPFCNASL